MAYRPTDDQLNQMMTGPSQMEAGANDVGQDPDQAAVLSAADELDDERERSMEMAAPEGNFSLEALNDLVDSLNKVLPMFNEPQPYPSFAEGIDGDLPTEFVSALMMVGQAAMDAGMERLAPKIEEMTDDAGLDKAARKMDTLADNQSFITFLKGTVPGTPKSAMSGAQAEEMPAEMPPPPAMPADMDQLLAARA